MVPPSPFSLADFFGPPAAPTPPPRRKPSSPPESRGPARDAGPASGPSAPEPADVPSLSARQGLWGERVAERWLTDHAGLRTLGRRVKVGRDELDLVMQAPPPPAGGSGEIVFVEVKTRSGSDWGGGRAALDRRKRHALCRAAVRWMRLHADAPMRIDLVEVYGSAEEDRVDRVDHQVAAVPLERRFVASAVGRTER